MLFRSVSIGVWIYLWASYFVPLICISVFVPVPYCLDDCGFVVEPEIRQVEATHNKSFENFPLISQTNESIEFERSTFKLYLRACFFVSKK